MTETKLSLGQAIDQILAAPEAVDEDSRATVLETVRAHLKIAAVTPVAPSVEHRLPPGGAEMPQHATREASRGAATPARDIRSLRTEKNPKSAREMACVVAFYLQELAPEGEKKESISSADLEKYFKQANFKLPEKIGQVLPDAKGSGYFDSATRGAYKLNAVGYNLVAHKLPATSAGG
jgi:hypothetical protein